MAKCFTGIPYAGSSGFLLGAAGNLVSAIALQMAVFHYLNPFQRHYQKHRQDVEGDRSYIIQKRKKES